MLDASARRQRDRLATVVVWSGASLVALALGWILVDLLRHGLGRLVPAFFVAEPRDAGRAGGVGPMVVSTLWVLAVCLATAVPIGLGTALFLTEIADRGSRAARWVRRSLDALAAVPSIVFGLFGNAFFSHLLGLGYSIAAGGLTLACMVLPLVIRSTEAGLAAVPVDWRRGAAALALSRWTTLRSIVLPAALPGLIVGLVLGLGRAVAETAALLFTSGSVDRWPTSVLDSGRTLSIHVYELSMHVPAGTDSAYATALVLVILMVITSQLAGSLTRRVVAPHARPRR